MKGTILNRGMGVRAVYGIPFAFIIEKATLSILFMANKNYGSSI